MVFLVFNHLSWKLTQKSQSETAWRSLMVKIIQQYLSPFQEVGGGGFMNKRLVFRDHKGTILTFLT